MKLNEEQRDRLWALAVDFTQAYTNPSDDDEGPGVDAFDQLVEFTESLIPDTEPTYRRGVICEHPVEVSPGGTILKCGYNIGIDGRCVRYGHEVTK